MNILDLMTKTPAGFEPRLDKGQRMLFVARSGAGKTAAELSLPKPLYVFDLDNRIKGGLAALKWLGEEEFKSIDFDYYNPRDGFKAIDDKLSIFFAQANKKDFKYKTLIIDSLVSFVYSLALDSQRLRGELKESSGKIRGSVKFLHPDDYNYVSTAMRILIFNYIMPLNELGINTLFSSWVVDRWAKKPGASEYAPSEIIGEKLVGPANFVEEVIGYFDEVYRFYREPSPIPGKDPRFFVEYNGAFAKTALGLPPGKMDITGKSFYAEWISSVKNILKGA